MAPIDTTTAVEAAKLAAEKTSTPSHLLVAVSELGQQEIKGKAFNYRIGEYLKSVGLPSNDEIPWCAAFINWVLKQVGIVGTNRGLAKGYLKWGVECQCEIGAIAVMNRGFDPALGHVAFVLQDNGKTILTIGGNQNDRVSIVEVRKEKIVSYRRVT